MFLVQLTPLLLDVFEVSSISFSCKFDHMTREDFILF